MGKPCIFIKGIRQICLNNYFQDAQYSNGTLRVNLGDVSTAYPPSTGTLGVAAGLWYFEVKCVQAAVDNNQIVGFLSSTGLQSTSRELGYYSTDWGYYGYAGAIRNNNGNTSYGDTWTTDDIIGCYLDLTANKLYFAKGSSNVICDESILRISFFCFWFNS